MTTRKLRQWVVDEYDIRGIVDEIHTEKITDEISKVTIIFKNGVKITGDVSEGLIEIPSIIEEYLLKERIQKIKKIKSNI